MVVKYSLQQQEEVIRYVMQHKLKNKNRKSNSYFGQFLSEQVSPGISLATFSMTSPTPSL
jgi:hypothetical protein